MPSRPITPDDADNPYAPPQVYFTTLSVTGGANGRPCRKLSPLESFARAVGILCLTYAILDGSLALYHGGWVILAKFGSIPLLGPIIDPMSSARLRWGTRSSHGSYCRVRSRNLRRWSLWSLGVLALAIFLQFAVQAYIDYHERGNLCVAPRCWC